MASALGCPVPLQHFPVGTVGSSVEARVGARPKTRCGNSDKLLRLGKTKQLMEAERLANQNMS